MDASLIQPSCFSVHVRGEKERMGSSLDGRPEKRSWAKLWIKKLNFVATLPRLDSINLSKRQGVKSYGWKSA